MKSAYKYYFAFKKLDLILQGYYWLDTFGCGRTGINLNVSNVFAIRKRRIVYSTDLRSHNFRNRPGARESQQ